MLTARDILKVCDEENVKFLRLMFTDILGMNKNVEVPRSQFEKALAGDIMFDGSSIEGFARIEESDMLLNPDLQTFRIFPWEHKGSGKVARLICDIYNPDHAPFDGCPRLTLKRSVEEASAMGYRMVAGPEVEFFLFQVGPDGDPTTETHDVAGYFDLTPVDMGEDARREVVEALEVMGFEVEAAHHEVAPGQHEIDFRYADVIEAADNIMTFKFIVKKVALDFNLHASFMPKPIFGVNGSGMHTHMSLIDKDGQNVFYDDSVEGGLSDVALGYIGGTLSHVRSYAAITNPLVNSYKRLVPGYEAPINVAWSEKNRSPLVRVPAKRGMSTRCEVRVPDPACNPYLALAVMLSAGLDGVKKQTDPGEPVNRNIFTMSEREKRRLKIKQLPKNLSEALDFMEKDKLVRETLGGHIFDHYLSTKRMVWHEYISTVHTWEVDRYLGTY